MLLAATPNTAYAIFALLKYNRLQFLMPLGQEFDVDRLILITLSMISIGVVGLVIWDGVFPDRRDVRVLGVLPIPTRRFVLARLGSLGRVRQWIEANMPGSSADPVTAATTARAGS